MRPPLRIDITWNSSDGQAILPLPAYLSSTGLSCHCPLPLFITLAPYAVEYLCGREGVVHAGRVYPC